jgi:hypothetical protein
MRYATTISRKTLLWSALCLASCTPAGENNTVSAPRLVKSNEVESGIVPILDAGVDADQSAGAQYARREWVITRGNGMLVFEAPGEWTCAPLPEKRPVDFTLILQQRRGEPGDWTYYGVSEKEPCRFAWGMSWMEPPPAACKALDGAAFDKLYEELRKLSPETIRSRQIKEYVSPHRGGWAIHMRWARIECAVSDILDSEVDAKDRARFDAVQDLVRKAYQ